MARIEIGQRLKTNYGTGPYYVTSITRGCTCSHILDEIEGKPKPTPEHIHLSLKGCGGDHNEGGHFGLNYYDEETLKSVVCDDRIILLENPVPIQQSFLV